jgi:hypothetical protein
VWPELDSHWGTFRLMVAIAKVRIPWPFRAITKRVLLL